MPDAKKKTDVVGGSFYRFFCDVVVCALCAVRRRFAGDTLCPFTSRTRGMGRDARESFARVFFFSFFRALGLPFVRSFVCSCVRAPKT